MRYREDNYKITVDSGYVYIHINVTNDDYLVVEPMKKAVRLIVDETAKIVFCSSMQKDKILEVASSSEAGYNIRLKFAIPTGKTVTVSDVFTVELDFGEQPVSFAKQGTNVSATNTAILAAIPTVQQIQSGLAKPSDLPTGYALQGSDATATNTAIASTLGAPSDAAAVATVFGHLAQLKGILDLVNTHVGGDSLTLNEKLDIIRTVIGEISLVQNNDNVGSGNQAWTLVLNQSLAVNNETLEQA